MWIAKLLRRIIRKKKKVDLKTVDNNKQTIIHINIITQIQNEKTQEAQKEINLSQE